MAAPRVRSRKLGQRNFLDVEVDVGLTTVLRVIRSPIMATVAVIVIAVVFFILDLVAAGAAWLVARGKDCSFENLEYGRRFADANKDG